MVELFQHPLPVDAMFVSVMQDVDLPEREQELAAHRIAHGRDHNPAVVDNRLRKPAFIPRAAGSRDSPRARAAPESTCRADPATPLREPRQSEPPDRVASPDTRSPRAHGPRAFRG